MQVEQIKELAPGANPDLIETVLADVQLQQALIGMSFEAELNQPLMRFLLEMAEDAAQSALHDFASCLPDEVGKVARAQAEFNCYSGLRVWVQQQIETGREVAEAAQHMELYEDG